MWFGNTSYPLKSIPLTVFSLPVPRYTSPWRLFSSGLVSYSSQPIFGRLLVPLASMRSGCTCLPPLQLGRAAWLTPASGLGEKDVSHTGWGSASSCLILQAFIPPIINWEATHSGNCSYLRVKLLLASSWSYQGGQLSRRLIWPHSELCMIKK